MKKILVLFVSILILNACNISNTPKSKVESFLNEYNTLSENVIMDIEINAKNENLTEENKSYYMEVLKRQYQALKYEIKDEIVDGNKATVVVKITVYDLYKSINETEKYAKINQEYFNDVNNIFNEEKYETYKIQQMLKTNDKVDYEIEFYLNKKDNTWELENPDRITLEKIHGFYNYDNN